MLGDRHQDLTYAALPLFQHGAEDGSTVIASGMMPEEQSSAAYAEASGLPLDPQRLAYFGVFNRYMVCLRLLAAARAHRPCAARIRTCCSITSRPWAMRRCPISTASSHG